MTLDAMFLLALSIIYIFLCALLGIYLEGIALTNSDPEWPPRMD